MRRRSSVCIVPSPSPRPSPLGRGSPFGRAKENLRGIRRFSAIGLRRPQRALEACFSVRALRSLRLCRAIPRMCSGGLVLLLIVGGACDKKGQQEVVVYTSQDREDGEAIF